MTQSPPIPFAQPDIGGVETAAVTEGVRPGWLTTCLLYTTREAPRRTVHVQDREGERNRRHRRAERGHQPRGEVPGEAALGEDLRQVWVGRHGAGGNFAGSAPGPVAGDGLAVQRAEPVSYTHLDVYKRQWRRRPRWRRGRR